jgi:hypothetical protein
MLHNSKPQECELNGQAFVDNNHFANMEQRLKEQQ